ncbi:MAG: hypothetical protein HN742_08855 [Lentisphaerae bacterium]|nr:hypothetical protein [Lentisphaerota bacterium]MBT7054710.1 hypothetical protein [Lentisphaerota bacterium]MBT7841968.1 hypothetical protein [Lentisphaerota bacterium]
MRSVGRRLVYPTITVLMIALGLSEGRSAVNGRTKETARYQVPPGVTPPRMANAPAFSIPSGNGPRFYLNDREIRNLREAYAGAGEAALPLQQIVTHARDLLVKKVVIPPKGGQHSSHYNCPNCERKLRPAADGEGHACPKCKTVYTGSPYEEAYYDRIHKSICKNARLCAQAYILTGNEEFARYTRGILLEYADRYLTYERHDHRMRGVGEQSHRSGGHLFAQTLGEAYAMSQWLGPAFDMICGSNAFALADQKRVKDGLIRPMLTSIFRLPAGKSNHQSWHNAAYILGGAILDEPEWIQFAIWNPKNGFHYQLGASVSEVGLWQDGGWSYHFYARKALLAIAEVARHLDIDLWGEEQFMRMFLLPAAYRLQNGHYPNFGDAHTSDKVVRREGEEESWAVANDPRLAIMLPEDLSWESIRVGRTKEVDRHSYSAGSALFESNGHFILRGGKPGTIELAVLYGKHDGWHSHYDKSSFVLYARGKELGVDPGKKHNVNYPGALHQTWHKASLSHNLVTVDGKSQASYDVHSASGGELLCYNDEGGIPVAGCTSTETYPGVTVNRWLAAAPHYALVMDDLSSDSEHLYEWWYHNKGTEARCSDADRANGDATSEADLGFVYVQNVKRGSSRETIEAYFDHGELTVHVMLARGGRTAILTGNGPYTTPADRVPLMRFGRRGGAVRFAAVIEPRKVSEENYVRDIVCKPIQGGNLVIVSHQDGSDTYRLRPDSASVEVVR